MSEMLFRAGAVVALTGISISVVGLVLMLAWAVIDAFGNGI